MDTEPSEPTPVCQQCGGTLALLAGRLVCAVCGLPVDQRPRPAVWRNPTDQEIMKAEVEADLAALKAAQAPAAVPVPDGVPAGRHREKGTKR